MKTCTINGIGIQLISSLLNGADRFIINCNRKLPHLDLKMKSPQMVGILGRYGCCSHGYYLSGSGHEYRAKPEAMSIIS